MSDTPESWHTVKEAAALIGLNAEVVYKLIESRRLGHRRLGEKKGRGKIQIGDKHIAAFLESCEVPVAMENSNRPKQRQARTRASKDYGPLKYFP